jgi:hydroxypyruvate reductase
MTMLSAESFWTSSLHLAPEGGRITRILAASINAIDPGAAVEHFIKRDGDLLTISGRVYDLQFFHRVVLLGIGKASIAMSKALAKILADRLSSGVVITKHAAIGSHPTLTILSGDHPIPGERSLEAGKKAIELVSSLGPNDLLFCLISGGGSALVASPVSGVSLANIQVLTSALISCGARIDEINTLRRRLELFKGGGVVKMAAGTTIISLILSDVVGNPLEAIASGPTAPDPATRAEAFSILAKYGLENRIPISILHSLKTSPETPKPGDLIFEKVQNVIVGNNLMAAQAALTQAEVEGFNPYLLRTDLQGEARQVAFELATFLRQASLSGDPLPGPACIVAGGETTVTLTGKGKGGRNTELALAAVTELADFPGVMLVTLATDGEDGSTDAAGAVVTGGTFHRAAGLGMHPTPFLERNDSYSFFSPLDDLLKPGPTGTNGNDLVFLFIF